VPPSQIWAATFTRKAAGEILDRVLERLIAAAGSDAKAKELAVQIGCPDVSQTNCTRLLRELLGSLHRLRIGTLDSLFLKLAGAFGLECGLPPGWSICDEVEDQAANEMALDAVLAGDRDRQTWLAERYERLTHGEARRGVRSDLLGRIANWYAAYRTVPKEGWQTQSPPRPLESLDDLLEALEAAGSGCDKRMKTACEKDCILAREPRWDEFFTKGLGPKIYSGEKPEYNRKPIPQVLIDLYRRILPIARFNVLDELAAETAALWEFLHEFDRHREGARRGTGALRFDDVTLALAEHLAPESAGFQFRLDGGIGHLLIDEFQDTSTAQWRVLRKLAEERLREGGTFFAVGDVKQAIYGWRGGRVELLQRLPEDLGGLPTDQMDESRRSAPEIVDVVNTVFENVIAAVDGEWWEDRGRPWNKDFRHHTTFEKERKGYVQIETGPAQAEGEGIAAVRTRHYAWVAGRIKKLMEVKPTATIGVLCRTNSAVGHLLFDLRQLGVEASEEGENPITDSPAVELILSMLTLADHPGDRVAAFHLAHSPLAERLVESGFQDNETAEFASRLRRSLVEDGYAAVVAHWAHELAKCCPAADRLRLRQLVELADAHQARATLRPAEFVAWVRKQRISAPSASRLRVLTLHKAKGLEFDAVVLPQLDVPLKGRPADFVVADPGPTSHEHGFVARRPSSGLQLLL
ncbi:MAG TPA: UvrD-helicase domain-containing protein, partial [Gemmata sp.]|nr:UvrD-helicase domain-containing protein [Gemmata sp.]